MFSSDMARIDGAERTTVPRLFLAAGLFCAVIIGYLVVANMAVGIGFMTALLLLILTVAYPVVLAPAMVVLSVFIEKALTPLSITVGGRELLNFVGVVNLCLIAACALYTATRQMRPFQSLITKPFALYLAVVLASLVYSADTMMTAKSFVRISSGFCIYLLVTQFLTEKRQIDRVFQILVIISVIPIAVGLYQIAFRNHFIISRDLRIPGTFRNGMSYAMYLAIILPYIFGQLVFSKGSLLKRGFLLTLFLAGLANLVYSATRIGLGVFALAMIVYAMLSSPKKLLPAILVLLFLSVIVFFPYFEASFGGFFRTGLKTYMSNDVSWDMRSSDYITASSFHIRVFVWRHMIHKLVDTNVLLGVGSGTWFDNFDKKTVGFLLASHSDYLEVAFGTGLVGLSVYVLFRIKQLLLLVRFAKSDAERDVKTMVLFPCLATHVACLGMSITEVWQAYDGIYWLSWIAVGISESYYRWYCRREGDSQLAEMQEK
jgi:O-antigen ligase